ncbi:MAG: enoyl-CoA hydratase/isomerase family protein [Deltaproteobacteria bacterium]|nr:enoyl-CoA hydratase/isomerase family protein [Deltaproteobacteria bacterium]
MEYKYLLFEKQNHIAKISLNIPETKNALNLEVRDDLMEVLTTLRDDDSVHVVILTGTGAAFCAGGDIRTMEDVTPVAGRIRLKKGQRLIKAMVELEKPIIAAINGTAAGAGVSLALASDILLASETAKFFISFTRVGLTPDWGQYYFLPLRVGLTKAKELMFTGDPVDAKEAERIGLINKVYPHKRLEEEAYAWAERLARGPTQSYAMIKAALNRWPSSLESFLEMESVMQAVAFSSDDFDEGRRAFLEKRAPQFKGK